MTLASFYHTLKFEKRCSPHTVNAYQTDIEQFVEYLSSQYALSSPDEATQAIVRSWLAKLVDEGLTSRSINRKLSALKAYYNHQLRLGEMKTNPASRVNTLKIPKRLPVSVSKAEIHSALYSQDEHETDFSIRRDHLILELLYGTGIRLSELTGLKISDVDFGSQTIKVTGKRNKQRIVPLGNKLLEVIQAYLEERNKLAETGTEEIILTDKGKKAYSVFIYRKVTRYLGEAGVKGRKSPHVLRHTFATHMLNAGADLNAIKELLGHASLAATQVYTHVSVEKLKSIYKQAHPRA
ncbi:MAG: tyrosine-type recombinase/integrase [Lentimicrobium sp.]|jgi:integrase/recombinase XerC|nr:tyrosine-type recombinase/integrase [Lentimicrobium sp.]